MKYLVSISLLSLLCSCNGDTTSKTTAPVQQTSAATYQSDAQEAQAQLRAYYENEATTPLKPEDKAGFKGITFFPINHQLVVKAAYTPIENGKVIPFATSANKQKFYKEAATLAFTLEGKSLQLTAYVPDPMIPGQESFLFVPFRDATSGISSYGAGRYLDLSAKDIQDNSLMIDFNKAYNPYCAYSTAYNCPIPPASNTLAAKIEAGVSYLLQK